MRRIVPFLAATFAIGCDGPSESPVERADTSTAADTTLSDASVGADSLEETEEIPYLMSRFGPTVGVGGTRVKILTAFPSEGCKDSGECGVTIDGQTMDIVADVGLLEVVVPRFVSTGPLCVTWRARTECGEDFVVLGAPVVRSFAPMTSSAGVRDFVVEIIGEGFPDNAEVLFNGERIAATFVWPDKLMAVVPTRLVLTPGTYALEVYAPEVSRCGVRSPYVDFVVTE